jgi:xylulose-5-phosphate/fructose-6-phosphate phosphoketolase
MTAKATSAMTATRAPPVNEEALQMMDAYWRAANHLSVGKIHLCGNLLLRVALI